MTPGGSVKAGLLRRALVIVLDGVGVGALPDAADYGDSGADTLGNIARAAGGLGLPALASLGLGAVAPIAGLAPADARGAYGKMREASAGKDSTTGHWEIAGVVVEKPYPTFPGGFPAPVVAAFEADVGRSVIGNVPASGTEIIKKLGEEHLRTGSLILYTSADSVFQLAAHERVLPASGLYEVCRRVRELLDDMGLPVLRVIARPFSGEAGAFERGKRRDFSLPPPGRTVLERLHEAGRPVLGIGKVGDIFCGRGFDDLWEFSGNRAGLSLVVRAMKEWREGVVLANILDFDTLYGHRNDAGGFAESLIETDALLAREILPRLGDDDLLIVTADHGCDPTTESTDHSREYVPVLATTGRIMKAVNLGVRETFSDVGATVLEALTGETWHRGTSFLREILASAIRV